MKKDIKIPKVEDVLIAVVREVVPETDDNTEWSVYILNNKVEDIELVIVVSDGFSHSKKTSTLRKTIDKLPQKSFAKIEILQKELFQFTNQFKVSFFKDNQLYDKTFTFKPNTISDKNLTVIPLLEFKGILAE